MASSSTAQHQKTLADMWSFLLAATKETPTSYFDAYGQFFEEDCIAYLSGLGAPPSIGRQAVIDALKFLHTFWGIIERRVVSSAIATEPAGALINGMDNKLRIADQVLEHFHELEVVTFGEHGLVKEYKLYADSTSVFAIMQNTKDPAAVQALQIMAQAQGGSS